MSATNPSPWRAYPVRGEYVAYVRVSRWRRAWRWLVHERRMQLVRKHEDGSREYCCRRGHLLQLGARIHAWWRI